ncbi:hypothetical protein BDR26DRAFT_850907 [Obelidium mucronatum]|nr:hypothetical protein BDR26DRAFT_850907 [Obelidium mucronatum]
MTPPNTNPPINSKTPRQITKIVPGALIGLMYGIFDGVGAIHTFSPPVPVGTTAPFSLPLPPAAGLAAAAVVVGTTTLVAAAHRGRVAGMQDGKFPLGPCAGQHNPVFPVKVMVWNERFGMVPSGLVAGHWASPGLFERSNDEVREGKYSARDNAPPVRALLVNDLGNN